MGLRFLFFLNSCTDARAAQRKEFTIAFNRLIESSCEQIGCTDDTGRSALNAFSPSK